MKTILLLLMLAGGAAIGWYTVSPRSTVEDLREAARAGDTAALDQLIAYDSVRANLKTDLRARLDRLADRDQPLATLGAVIGGAFVEGLIDTFVSPMGLSLILAGRSPEQGTPARPAPDDEADYTIDRQGLGRFAVRFESDGADGSVPVLEFRRHGLDWRLVRIAIDARED